jgi:hypothetical protein
VTDVRGGGASTTFVLFDQFSKSFSVLRTLYEPTTGKDLRFLYCTAGLFKGFKGLKDGSCGNSDKF